VEEKRKEWHGSKGLKKRAEILRRQKNKVLKHQERGKGRCEVSF